MLQLPLSVPTGNGDDRVLLVEEQREDNSLASMRRMADEQENGYKHEDGLVVHTEVDELSTVWTRIVVPHYCVH